MRFAYSTLQRIKPRVFRHQTAYFMLAWLPIAGLALFGSTLETIVVETCPRALGNIPACYYSLGISALVLVFYWFGRNTPAE